MLSSRFLRLDAHSKYFFVHVPKTGGTSLFRWLAGIYGPENCCEHIESLVLPEPSREVIDHLKGFNVIGGHVPIDWWQFFSEFGFMPITIVRNPVEQFYSHVNHLLSQDLSTVTNTMLPIIRSKLKKSIGYFLENGTAEELLFFENSQSKPIFGSSFPWRESPLDVRRSWLKDTYAAVLTTEAMDAELPPKIDRFTLQKIERPRENVSVYHKEVLTDDQKSILGRLLREDFELHKLALEMSLETALAGPLSGTAPGAVP